MKELLSVVNMEGVYACHGPSHPLVIARHDIPPIAFNKETTAEEENLLILDVNNSLLFLKGNGYFAPDVQQAEEGGCRQYILFADDECHLAYKKKLATTTVDSGKLF